MMQSAHFWLIFTCFFFNVSEPKEAGLPPRSSQSDAFSGAFRDVKGRVLHKVISVCLQPCLQAKHDVVTKHTTLISCSSFTFYVMELRR